jgi:peptidyl-prolyl cis-trans isomerase D
MASQAPKAAQKPESREVKRGIKNPGIYAGTIIVLALVVITFVFMPMGGGSGSITDNGRSLEFGRFAGKAIIYGQGSYMAGQVRSLNDQLRQQGLNESNYQLFAYQVYRGAFERTVLRMAAIDAVKRAGGSVTEPWIDARVAESPAYQENGTFSAQKYQAAPLSEKLALREQVRDDQLYQDYFSYVLGVRPSSQEIAFVKDMAKQQRTIEYAAVPLSKFPDSEVEAWGKIHADLFRVLNLSRVTVASSEADAKKLLKNVVDKKATFEDVAKASSKDAFASKGGAAGTKYFHELVAEFAAKADADAIAALKKGELSGVLKTAAGSWVFFRADADIAPADFAQGIVVAAVRNYMTNRERGAIEDWAIAQAKTLVASGAKGSSLEAAAKKSGFEAKTAGPFPLNYGDAELAIYGQRAPLFKAVPNEGALAGASTSEKFLTQAFTLAPGSSSEPFVLGDNALVVKVKEAGSAKDDETGSIDFYYPYFFQSGASSEVRDIFMKSSYLKDDFGKIFFKYFQPAQAAAGSSGGN